MAKIFMDKKPERSLPALTDKTTVIGFIIEQLKEAAQQERLLILIPHLHIFGISVMTQLHIRLFNELSKYISVSFYLLNPAPSVYWLDDRTEKQIARIRRFRDRGPKSPEELQGIGNTLLVGWGKLVQETFSLLFEHEAFLNVYNDAMVEEPVAVEGLDCFRRYNMIFFIIMMRSCDIPVNSRCKGWDADDQFLLYPGKGSGVALQLPGAPGGPKKRAAFSKRHCCAGH
jgi:hypothetical protein